MTSARKAVGFGILMWLIPFVIAWAAFPLRTPFRPLFESVMAVAVAGSAVGLAVPYFRRVTRQHVREGLVLGLLWLAICVLIDAPLMLFGGPMQMSLSEYLADIGLTYVIITTVTLGIGAAARPRLA